MKILMGAQSCGFGPISKLAALSLLVPQHHRVFCGDTVASLYARRNAEAFDELYDTGEPGGGPRSDLLATSDWVVSVMDADLVMRAFAADRPVVMVDSLFSFWQHERPLADLAELCRRAPRGPADRVLSHFEALRPHERILAAHMLATHSVVQNFQGVQERIDRFADLGVGRLHLTGSIVDADALAGAATGGEPDCDLLINIGGFKNFLLDFDVNNAYLKLFDRWIPDLLSDWKRFAEVTVCCGAFGDGREREVSVGSSRARLRMLSHRDFLRTVATASHYMLTPGLTAIHESVALRQFPMALPEQHFGHVFNLESLPGTLFHRIGARLSAVVPDHPVPQDDFEGTAAINEIAERIGADAWLYKRFRNMMNEWIETFVALDVEQRAAGVEELGGRLGGRPLREVVDELFGMAVR
jgi:hypothetical protein